MAAGYFLLLAQKKVTKENGTLGIRAVAARAVRCGRTGFADRPSMACGQNRRDPSRRPARCAGFSVRPSPLHRGTREQEQRQMVLAFAAARAPLGAIVWSVLSLLRQGRPRSALPGFPLGRGEQAEEKVATARPAGCAARSTSVHGRAVGEPRSLLAQSPGRMPGDRGREGVFLFGYFLLGKQEKVTRAPWMADEKTHGRESVLARKRADQTHKQRQQSGALQSPCPLPQAGEGKRYAACACNAAIRSGIGG